MKTNLSQYSATPAGPSSAVVNLKMVVVLVLLFTTSTSFCQSKQYRFIAAKFNDIARYAHPFNTPLIQKSLIMETTQYVEMIIYYTDSYTKLRFTKGNFPYYISSMWVVEDTDIYTPFKALDNWKDMAISFAQNSNNGTNQAAKNQLERALYDNLKTWKSPQLVLFCLNMEFLDFK